MAHKNLPFAAAVAAVGLLGTTGVLAQNAQQSAADSPAPASQIAKPSPYQGVSNPPANDVILTNDDQPDQTPASSPAPAPAVTVNSAQRTVAAAPPSPEVDADDDAEPAVSAPILRRDDRRSDINADEGVVTYVPGPANALPEGTVFDVRMLQNVMAADTTPGTEFKATLTQNLVHEGRVVVPIGSVLVGKIAYVSYGRRISGPSVIHLRPDEFILPDGTRYRVQAKVIDTKGSDTKATEEGNISCKAHGTRAALELAAGGGGGALIGAELGGPVGAAVGSAVGVGAMGAHLLLANRSVDLPEQSIVIFTLTNPMYLTPSRD